MKKLKIWALSIIMIFSFSGLLLLQVSYIEKMVKMRNEQFDESVKRSLNQVSHNLEYDETLKYLENELYKSIDDDKMPHSGSLLQHRYKSYAKGNDIYSSFELRTITMQPAQTPKIIITRDNFNKNKTIKQTTETLQETLKNKFVFQRSLLDEVALNILYQASEVPITKRINIKQLDYYIKKELNNNGINLNYHYTIHDNSGHEIYRCSDFDAKGIDKAYQQTRKDTHQAMEGFIHNLNTMHSRGGNQVVFSSINYGTDTSAEGRMVIEELLNATIEGLGTRGEVPVFPIQIFKIKDGVSYSEADYRRAMEDFEAAMDGKVAFEAPNFDLFLKACRTTAKALFPNFMFLDTPFNKHEAWRADDPKRYRYELATMGCRTRVFENLNGEKTSLGRGNLSFTTMNLPRLAIEARRKAEQLLNEGQTTDVESTARSLFLESVHRMASFIAEQLYARYQYQRTALARQFPFMMGNDVWKGGGKLNPNDEVGDVLNQGTLGIGFIGGHNAMVALYGQGHGHNQKAWQTLYDAVLEMNKVADEYKAKYHLNYSILATPAEGLSGRFTKIDQKKYGIIPGVNDRDYYVNSFHVDVKEPITIVEKIKCEAPFHALTRGGHITYVELDGEAKKNIKAIAKIVKVMHDEGIGYGSINHPVDTCHNCGYKGVIYDKCPICRSENILRMRRITGYLTGDLSSWNSAKRAEEHDRVKHG